MKLSESEMVEGFRQYSKYAQSAKELFENRVLLFGHLASMYIDQGNTESARKMLGYLSMQAHECLGGLQHLVEMVEKLEG